MTLSTPFRKIHVDIDPSEINKNVRVDVGIVGDLREVLGQLLERVRPCTHDAWFQRIAVWRAESELRDIVRPAAAPQHPAVPEGKLLGAQVIRDLFEFTEGDAVTVTDVGQHQMWEAQYYQHERPHSLITSGGLGTMGFGLPAAIGAKMARPDQEVWAIVGDGGFQMTLQELATAVEERLPVKIALINNGHLGMVRQWQEMYFDNHLKAVPVPGPDYIKLAEAYGVGAARVSEREDVLAALQQARAYDGPFLIEFVVDQAANVYPMVPPGGSLADTLEDPAITV